MQFRNREHAASLLAARLAQYGGSRPLVLGIPRGGVPMARIIADELGGDLDVMLVHKLRAPSQPELAIGSIDESGRVYLAPFADDHGISKRLLDAEAQEQLATLKRRRIRYAAAHPRTSLAGRTVILVDDGLATGATALAAIRAARAEHASRIVVAVGVAPWTTLGHLETEADDVVCLQTPADFQAVGAYFADFSEVSDDDVVSLLAQPRTQAAFVNRESTGAPSPGGRRGASADKATLQ